MKKAIEKTRKAAKGDNLEALKSAIHELEQASHALSQSLYATDNASPGPPGAQTGAGDDAAYRPNGRPVDGAHGGHEEDAIDAEFEVKQ